MDEDSYTIVKDFEIKEGEGYDDVLNRTGQPVFDLIKDVIYAYMDMDDDDITVLTAWIMAAAFKQGFQTMPILFINGSKGSGKTHLMKLINALIPDSLLTFNLTESALFRIASKKRCLLIDEAEKSQINNKERVNLTELLNSCYKRGGQVVRIEKGKGQRWEPEYYTVYNPVVLANIYGLNSIIEDRSISIVLKKTTDQTKIRIPELFEHDPLIQVIRAWFLKVSEGVEALLEIAYTQQVSAYFLYNIYISKHTIPTITITLDVVKDFLKKSEGLKVSGRDFELWLPLMLITFTFNPKLTDSIIMIATDRIKDKVESDVEFDRDTSIAIKLWAFTSNLEFPQFYPKEFREWYMAEENLTQSERKEHFLTPEWIGHFLKRLKAINKKDKTNKGFRYSISKAKLKAYLDARNASEEAQAVQEIVKDTNTMGQQGIVKTHPGATVANPEADPDWDKISAELEKGIVLGYDFEAVPKKYRSTLESMRQYGAIYEFKPGCWKKVHKEADATGEIPDDT